MFLVAANGWINITRPLRMRATCEQHKIAYGISMHARRTKAIAQNKKVKQIGDLHRLFLA
jgi:hypothetical protein